MTRIVRTAYRYKRPPKRKKPVALEVPAVVKAADPEKARRKRAAAPTESAPEMVNATIKRAGASAAPAANDGRKPAVLTIQRQSARIIPSDLLAETPEEHRRRGDAADALFREIQRRIGEQT